MQDTIKISDNDNVVVALKDLKKGETVTVEKAQLKLQDDIQRGHKIALADIKEREVVIKYGFPIGHATQSINAGSHVHVHNIKTNLGDDCEYTYNPIDVPSAPTDFKNRTFLGCERRNGKVGIRNELWIVPTVGRLSDLATASGGDNNTHRGSGNVRSGNDIDESGQERRDLFEDSESYSEFTQGVTL